MNTRLTINLASGIIEAEGGGEFVERVYGDFKDAILNRAAQIRLGQPVESSIDDNGVEAEDASAKAKKSRKRGKASGPSCASRIQALKDENYFAELRSATDVGAKLREKGTAYEGKHVAASLIDLVKRGALRRVSEAGTWMYQNP